MLVAAAYPGGIYAWLARPTLNIAPEGSNVILSWPSSSSTASSVLQENADLGPAWVSVTNAPVLLTNGLNQVVLPRAPSGSHFFRLNGP